MYKLQFLLNLKNTLYFVFIVEHKGCTNQPSTSKWNVTVSVHLLKPGPNQTAGLGGGVDHPLSFLPMQYFQNGKLEVNKARRRKENMRVKQNSHTFILYFFLHKMDQISLKFNRFSREITFNIAHFIKLYRSPVHL